MNPSPETSTRNRTTARAPDLIRRAKITIGGTWVKTITPDASSPWSQSVRKTAPPRPTANGFPAPAQAVPASSHPTRKQPACRITLSARKLPILAPLGPLSRFRSEPQPRGFSPQSPNPLALRDRTQPVNGAPQARLAAPLRPTGPTRLVSPGSRGGLSRSAARRPPRRRPPSRR